MQNFLELPSFVLLVRNMNSLFRVASAKRDGQLQSKITLLPSLTSPASKMCTMVNFSNRMDEMDEPSREALAEPSKKAALWSSFLSARHPLAFYWKSSDASSWMQLKLLPSSSTSQYIIKIKAADTIYSDIVVNPYLR